MRLRRQVLPLLPEVADFVTSARDLPVDKANAIVEDLVKFVGQTIWARPRVLGHV